MTARSDPTRTGFRWALALLLTIPIAKAVLADSLDPDFFWHVRVADQLLARGIAPVPDAFSFMSKPGDWTPFSWLGEIAMKWAYDLAGLRGVVGVHALCSATFFAFIALACLEATRALTDGPRRIATLLSTAFAMMLSLAFLSFRPVTMALALLSAMAWLAWRDRRSSTRLAWLLVPATLVLTNLHLYVILWVALLWAMTIGAALDAWSAGERREPVGTRFVPIARDGDRPRKLLVRAIACSLAALCTPMLPGCVRNALWFNGEDPMVLHKLVAEITPFYAGAFGKVMLVGVVGIIAFAIRARRTLGFEQLATLLAAVAVLLQMGRFATVFAIFACPIAAVALPRLSDVVLARRPLQFATIAVTLLIAGRCLMNFPRRATTMDAWLTRTGDADSLRYPTDAATFVEAHVPRRTGHLINELTWGGYLIWRLGGEYQVFMDGRTLIYPADFWKTLYLKGEPARRELLASQDADAAIVPATKSLLRSSLQSLGWRDVYADDRAVVMVPPIDAQATAREP